MPQVATRFAEGLRRRVFTAAEILRLQEAGIIGEEENFELVEGEIVPIPAKTHRHELIKSALVAELVRALPLHLWLGVESTICLSRRTLLEPDLVIYPRGLKLEEVKGADIVLAVEVAAASLSYDLGLKAKLYARYGLGELWVIDADRSQTHVHREPSRKGWGSIAVYPAPQPLTHPALPDFALSLSAF